MGWRKTRAVWWAGLGLLCVAGAGAVAAGVTTQPVWLQAFNEAFIGVLVIVIAWGQWVDARRAEVEARAQASARKWASEHVPGDWQRGD